MALTLNRKNSGKKTFVTYSALQGIQGAMFLVRQAPEASLYYGEAALQRVLGFNVYDSVYDQTSFRQINGVGRGVDGNTGVPSQLPIDKVAQPDPRLDMVPVPTLASVVKSLNQRAGQVRFAVNIALAEKPVTVVGTEQAESLDSIFSALADLYGLQVTQREEDKVLVLARHKRKRATRITNLNQSVRAALPEPFVRALQIEEAEKLKKQVDALSAAMRTPNLPWEKMEPLQKRSDLLFPEMMRRINNENLLLTGAASRLKRLVDSLLAAQKDKAPAERQVAVQDLSPLGRSALGLTMMDSFLVAAKNFSTREPPIYLTRFNAGRVVVGPKEVGLQFSIPNAAGGTDTRSIGIYPNLP